MVTKKDVEKVEAEWVAAWYAWVAAGDEVSDEAEKAACLKYKKIREAFKNGNLV